MYGTVFTQASQNALAVLGKSGLMSGAYLAGGSGLALNFGHRYSEDFDFFSDKEFSKRDVRIWTNHTAKATKSEDLEYQTLHGQEVYYFHYPQEVVKIDFAYFPFEHVGQYLMDEKLRVCSVLDIGINKLHAFTTRKRGRDYVALYDIIHTGGLTLEELFKGYRLKFDVYVQPEEWAKHFMGILDATDQPRFLGKRTWDTIEMYFTNTAKSIVLTSRS